MRFFSNKEKIMKRKFLKKSYEGERREKNKFTLLNIKGQKKRRDKEGRIRNLFLRWFVKIFFLCACGGRYTFRKHIKPCINMIMT